MADYRRQLQSRGWPAWLQPALAIIYLLLAIRVAIDLAKPF